MRTFIDEVINLKECYSFVINNYLYIGFDNV